MGLDQTAVFRAWVQTVKSRRKGAEAPPAPPSTEASPFTTAAKELRVTVTALRDSLRANRGAYIRSSLLLGSGEEAMSESDRDSLDAQAQLALKKARALLGNLRASAKAAAASPQRRRHNDAVADLIEAYLKAVCGLYSEQRAVRVKKSAELQRLSRLGNLVRSSKKLGSTAWRLPDPEQAKALLPEGVDLEQLRRRGKSKSASPPVEEETAPSQAEEDGAATVRHRGGAKKEVAQQSRVAWEMEDSEEVTIEETPALAQENQMLYRRLNEVHNELEELTGKVVGIGKLQEVFTEKILEQETDILRIHESTVHSTENIKSGNQQLREALQNRAGMRVWIIFFLLVLTFTLLFLDWYNP